jgi:hypothetical protein
MQKGERDLLEVLKFELQFLEKGGYGRSPRESWRPVYIFEDSPTCMNYDCKQDPQPCSDCVLMQLVPPEFRFGKISCRQIPLNPAGETLDSLYRYGDDHQIEETLRNWLVATIDQGARSLVLTRECRNCVRSRRAGQPVNEYSQQSETQDESNPFSASLFHCDSLRHLKPFEHLTQR